MGILFTRLWVRDHPGRVVVLLCGAKPTTRNSRLRAALALSTHVHGRSCGRSRYYHELAGANRRLRSASSTRSSSRPKAPPQGDRTAEGVAPRRGEAKAKSRDHGLLS